MICLKYVGTYLNYRKKSNLELFYTNSLYRGYLQLQSQYFFCLNLSTKQVSIHPQIPYGSLVLNLLLNTALNPKVKNI